MNNRPVLPVLFVALCWLSVGSYAQVTTPAPVAVVTTPAPVAVVTTPAPVAAVTTPAPVAAVTTPAPVAAVTTPAPVAAVTTPAPAAVTTPAPAAATTPAPAAATTPAPAAATTPAPAAATTPAPAAATTPAPAAATTPAPAAATTPAPAAATTPAPAAATTPAPAAATTPAPAAVTTPAPAAVTTPAPAAVTTPAPAAVTTPAPAAVTTPAPAAVTTPAPAATTTAAPLTQNTTVETLATDLSRTGCGTEALCAAQPADCDPASGSCFFLNAKRTSGNNFEFGLAGESAGYVAATLSTDATLGGNDPTYVCANNNGVVQFFATVLDNGVLTVTPLNVNSVKGKVDGNTIQCTFAATVPTSSSRGRTVRSVRASNLAVAVSTGSFNATSGALGSPSAQIQTAVVDLANANATVTNSITNTTNNAITLRQSLSQAVLITMGVLGLTVL